MKTKTNKIILIQAAVHAFAQSDIMHGRMPDYDDYFGAVRIAVYIHNISKMINGKASAG